MSSGVTSQKNAAATANPAMPQKFRGSLKASLTYRKSIFDKSIDSTKYRRELFGNDALPHGRATAPLFHAKAQSRKSTAKLYDCGVVSPCAGRAWGVAFADDPSGSRPISRL